MPDPIKQLTREMLHNPAAINLERKAAPAVGITQAVYPVPQELKSHLLLTLLERGVMREALVFTRTKHRANRLWEFLDKRGIPAQRIHGNRSQAQRTDALAGFKSGQYRVLVATDIAARGIDVVALGHVEYFDVPIAAEDYIHRVGRTARAEMTGEAFTFVSREEEAELKQIERAVNKTMPRVTLPDFDYNAKPQQRFEVPQAERIAAIRAQRSAERARAREKAERRATSGGGAAGSPRQSGSHAKPAGSSPRPSGSTSKPAGSGGGGNRHRPSGSRRNSGGNRGRSSS
jgi:ATP-dependent RNA helicase RhlE